jgi:hypothetical protein
LSQRTKYFNLLKIPTNSNTANIATGRKTYQCVDCNKDGHTEDWCIKTLHDELARSQGNSPNTANVELFCYETCMINTDSDYLVTQNKFMADSGASTCMEHSRKRLTNFIPHQNEVKIGDKTIVESLGTGTFHGTHINKEGQEITITLNK